MAAFTNYATLSYNGQTLTSNTVTGEILDTVSVSKTALANDYAPGEDLAYVITLVNTGAAAIDGLTVSDDLGGYAFDGATVYPLAYKAGTLRYFVNGALQPAPAVTAGPPLTVSGLSIPAGGCVTLAYEADVTAYAPLGIAAAIENTVTVTGPGISTPLTATACIPARQGPELRIAKSLSPLSVSPNGTLTYTFCVENYGCVEAAASGNAVMADTFNPILKNISVNYNGAPWAAGTNYSYDAATGQFATLPGQLAVPAATYTQNADGTWSATPGAVTLTVSGKI